MKTQKPSHILFPFVCVCVCPCLPQSHLIYCSYIMPISSFSTIFITMIYSDGKSVNPFTLNLKPIKLLCAGNNRWFYVVFNRCALLRLSTDDIDSDHQACMHSIVSGANLS